MEIEPCPVVDFSHAVSIFRHELKPVADGPEILPSEILLPYSIAPIATLLALPFTTWTDRKITPRPNSA